MNILTKNIGFLLILCAVQPSWAAMVNRSASGATGRSDSRVSLAVNPTTAAMRRLPTLLTGTTTTATTTTTTATTTSSLMDVTECVDAYTECIKDPEVCGFDFEECTTNELFYAKKPQCNSVLLQCSSAGINALFGTTSTTNLATKNANDEYVYPTAGSILGQFVEAGAINNRLDKSSCVKRYTSCLKKENVCGEDFELCTSDREFKKQKIYCESTLARCTDEGKIELFGSTKTDSNPTSASRLGVMIKEGGDLASVNAVSTCYKVADQCILSACSANPYKCIVDSSTDVVKITQAIKDGLNLSSEQASALSEMLTSANVNSYIRGACKDTIGGNKYCHMTANEGEVPTASKLIDENERDEVYSDIYASRMNAVMRGKIQEFANEFDKQTKDKCVETIMACAMRSCGSGLGSACYKKVFGTNRDMKQSISGDNTYIEIQTGCEAIVNTDTNCQYAAAVSAKDGKYAYTYNDTSAFTKLFPKQSTKSDPLGAVERLNAALSENYNDAAIAELKKKCKNTAVSCIRSLCGTDFTKCYRNRTDVMTDTYSTADASGSMSGRGSGSSNTNFIDEGFAKSMNKVGGVLDFTIVRGLCINTVKEASACDEHLKLEAYSLDADNGEKSVWGGSSVRDAWVDAVKTGYNTKVTLDKEAVLIGCRVSDTKNGVCDESIVAECDTVDDKGCVYDKEEYQAQKEYQLSMAANTLFQEVLGDLELEAQAKYNAKLTQEQNMCMAANNGGIMGRKDIASTYMWVKLRSNRVPKNYSVNGLKSNEFVASNDLYGSFCRARVTIQSDDPDLQRYLQEGNNAKNWSTAYFAVGDVFTCGSWIPQSDLEKLAETVAAKKSGTNADGDLTKGQRWGVAGASILGTLGGGAITDVLQTKTGLGGLLGTNADKIDDCKKKVLDEEIAWSTGDAANVVAQCKGHDDYVALGYKITAASNSIIRKNSSSKSIRSLRIDKVGNLTQDVCGSDANYTVVEAKDLPSASACPQVQCKVINEHVNSIEDYCGETSVSGRVIADVVGAGLVGATSGITTAQIMKANNRAKFTADEQEFMNNVGNHIYCFIGADEAGTYGDLIEISID